LQLRPASYDFSALYLPGTYPNTPRDLFMDVFYPNENPFPRRFLDEDFFRKLLGDLAARYKGKYIGRSGNMWDDRDYDTNRYLNSHLYRGQLVGAKELERNLDYAPFFLTFWEGQPMIGYVWEKNGESVFTVGYLDENEWVHRPSQPKRSSRQNDGRGWYSDQFILFPMRSNYGVLNYPKGI